MDACDEAVMDAQMDSKKVALITGVTGQDGSYLAELLLAKGYRVHGLVRRNSDFTSKRIDPILFHERFTTHYGDVVDTSSLHSLLAKTQPTEVYHLAAQSHVAVSFGVPDYSAQVNALGTLRLLNAIREVGIPTRFYQASSSELFGGVPGSEPQSEDTPFTPRSPYSTGKLFAYWTTVNYRDAYGMHASNGILFNHESPRRGRNFVTKKISQAVARIARKEQEFVKLGNLSAERDWGYAREYVEAMWRILQSDAPDDYVIGTGVSYSVRQFAEFCFDVVGVRLEWKGAGADEKGYDAATGDLRVVVDPTYYRPLEVERLRANPSRATARLDWKATTLAPALARIMVRYDLAFDDYGEPDIVADEIVAKRWQLAQ
jgi:GDPmannose 4,6-dehydratase